MKEILTSKKTIVILCGLLLIMLISSFLASRTPKVDTITTPVSGSKFVFPQTDKVNVDNANSVKTTVNNFYKDSKFAYPEGDTVLQQTSEFQLVFILKEKLFQVNVLPYSSAQTRSLAENELLTKLGITKETACTLKVEVNDYLKTTLNQDPVTSRLSFCN